MGDEEDTEGIHEANRSESERRQVFSLVKEDTDRSD